MSDGADDEVLRHLRDDDEISISTTKADGEQVSTTIWATADGGTPYVRSVNGHRGWWYRRATARDGNGVEIGGTVHPVTLVHVDDPAEIRTVDAAFEAKYGARYRESTDAMLTDDSRASTLRVSTRS